MRSTTSPFRVARPVAAAGLVLAVALTGACGSSSSSSTPAASSSASAPAAATTPADASSAAPTATPTATTTASTPPAVASTPAAGAPSETVFRTAAEATRRTSARISVTSSTVPASGKAVVVTETGTLDYRTTTGELSLTAAGETEALKSLIVGKSIYVQIPGGGTGGKKWVREDLAALGFGSADPSQSLANLDAAVSNVRRVGTVAIAGTPTTEYTATLDPVKSFGAGASTAVAAIRSAGVTSATVQAYVDSQGRFRRVITKISAKAFPTTAGKTGPATVTSTQDLSDFGVAVHVTAPPASQVQSLTK